MDRPPAAAASGLYFPAPAGTEWQVASGYNTATHSAADAGDPYALDIVRTDGPTAGTPLLAPTNGTVSFVGSTGSRCIGIRDAASRSILMCHLSASPSVVRGQKVTRGQLLATVAAAGDAANNGLSHIHIAVSASGTGAVPFAGAYSLEDVQMPATGETGAYSGVTFRSTNAPNNPPIVNAGPDQLVLPGTSVTLVPQASDPDFDPLSYTWSQTLGPTVALTTTGPTTKFVAPTTDGARLRFIITAADPGSLFAVDTVEVVVSATAPPTPPRPAGEGTILSGSLPPGGGFGGLLWGGGTTAELVTAAGCPASAAPRFWVVQDGKFVGYISGAASFVNSQWSGMFSTGIPAQTILIGSCG